MSRGCRERQYSSGEGNGREDGGEGKNEVHNIYASKEGEIPRKKKTLSMLNVIQRMEA